MTELMQRLAGANPVPSGDPLTPEERAEADALLERLVADPPAARPRLRTRRAALAGGLAAALAAAGLVTIGLIDADDRGDGVLEQAVAAVSEDEAIYAIAERWRVTITPLEGGGRIRRESGLGRSWLWRAGGRSRFLGYRLRADGGPGALVTESVVDGARVSFWDAATNTITVLDRSGEPAPAPQTDDYAGFDPFSDPGAQLRRHVHEGALRVASRTRVRGRRAFLLVSRTLRNPSPGIVSARVTYAVDAHTFLPLAIRSRTVADADRRELLEARVEYLRYRRLPVTDAGKARLRMGPHPGAKRVR